MRRCSSVGRAGGSYPLCPRFKSPHRHYISASVLTADFGNLEREVKKVERAGADLLHLDVMDGNFVPNITFGPVLIKSLRGKSSLPFDTHLMINNPQDYLEAFIEAGSQIITFHREAINQPSSLIKKISSRVKVGLSINPETPVKSVEPFLESIYLLLVMSVHPGFGGQKFIKSALSKIERLREIRDKKNLSFFIEVDGGINKERAREVISAGADILVVGSFLFSAKNMKSAIEELKVDPNGHCEG